MRRPVVAGLGAGVGTTTLAAALHGVDGGVWRGGPVDVLVTRSHPRPLPAGIPVVVLVAARPVPAGGALVVLPEVARWRGPGGGCDAAGLLGLADRQLPADLRPVADAVRAVAAALLGSGVLHRPCGGPVPSSAVPPRPPGHVPVPVAPAAPPVVPAGRSRVVPVAGARVVPGGGPPVVPGVGPVVAREAVEPLVVPATGPVVVRGRGAGPVREAGPQPVRVLHAEPVLLHRAVPVAPRLVAGRPLRWAATEVAPDRTAAPVAAPGPAPAPPVRRTVRLALVPGAGQPAGGGIDDALAGPRPSLRTG